MIAMRRKRQRSRLSLVAMAALVAAILLTAGCAADRERDRLMKEKYPAYPEDIKRAIDQTYLMVGMDREQVYLVLGEPMCKKTITRNGKDVEAWMYPPGGMEPCRTAQHRLYFEEGRLQEWETKIVR
jgi:hypothetical protein